MATVTAMSAVRQVFQPRGVSKLVNLTSFKTCQTAMLGSPTGNPRKRSRNSSGLDLHELGNVDPPAKRSKTWQSTFVPTKGTRTIYPLRKPRMVFQATKPLTAPHPARAKARRAAVDTTVFQIYEDTSDEEMGNLLTHSANALDISGDETQTAAKMNRGKENVPPTGDIHAVASNILPYVWHAWPSREQSHANRSGVST